VPELVEEDADEEKSDEEDAADRYRRAPLDPVDGGDPQQEQKEREVKPDGRAPNVEQLDGSAHEPALPDALPRRPLGARVRRSRHPYARC
jgi:hypothetical protein